MWAGSGLGLSLAVLFPGGRAPYAITTVVVIAFVISGATVGRLFWRIRRPDRDASASG
jgi:hypothetical protein